MPILYRELFEEELVSGRMVGWLESDFKSSIRDGRMVGYFIYLELWTLHEVARVLSHLWKLKDQLEQMLDVLSMCGWGWNRV